LKVIIPLAGKGTRLRPHTHVTPKPMIRIAGKPVIDYVMDDLQKLGQVEQVIYITGHLKEKVEEYTRAKYPFDSVFIEQKVQDGTAGAVALARDHVDQPVFIIFVDTIFDADLSVVKNLDADGVIWVKEVEDYQRFGVVVTDDKGMMTKIVEKPKEPISKRANIGLYYIKNWKLLYEGIEHVLKAPKNKGEYYLTDAFQYMIDKGAKLKVVDVAGWYDAGEVGTLLETNRTMLDKGKARRPASVPAGVKIIDPVYIEDDVTLAASTIGPNVSIGAGSTVENSTMSNTLVGNGSTVKGAKLEQSLIGDAAVVEGVTGKVNVGDHSTVHAS
jgi:glucose-1-phosphate thymidylyltransferase